MPSVYAAEAGAMRAPVPREPMGAVQVVAGQGIATEFVVVPLPFWPVRGVFVSGGLPGVPTVVPLRRVSPVSVVAAYLRWWAGTVGAFWWMAAVLAGWDGAAGALALFAAALLATHLGRPTPQSRAQREILGLAAGLNADPGWLTRPIALRVFAELRGDWSMTHPDDAPVDWREMAAAADRIDVVLLPLLFALASYEARLEDTDDARRLRDRVWTAVQSRWEPSFLGAPPA